MNDLGSTDDVTPASVYKGRQHISKLLCLIWVGTAGVQVLQLMVAACKLIGQLIDSRFNTEWLQWRPFVVAEAGVQSTVG